MNSEQRQWKNVRLGEETIAVLEQRGWSIRDAEEHTGVSSGTVLNLKRGRAVKIDNVLQFARSVAPPGLRDVVELRWTQLAIRGETTMPTIDYAAGRIVGDPEGSLEGEERTPAAAVIRESGMGYRTQRADETLDVRIRLEFEVRGRDGEYHSIDSPDLTPGVRDLLIRLLRVPPH